MYEDRAYADLALAAGASGYVCKHTDVCEITLALETIQKGEIYVSPGMFNSRLRSQNPAEQSPQTLKEKQLSSRELQIFTMIGLGRNTHEIAGELAIAVSTVETYRERLKTKLNLATGSELARHAFFWVMHNTQLRANESLRQSTPIVPSPNVDGR
jgi:DNA-binding NarL/FixJ family response regulator